MKGICEVCGREVGKLERAAWPVTGWEPERDKGANQILLRQREPGRVAHLTCIQTQAFRDQTSLDLGSAA